MTKAAAIFVIALVLVGAVLLRPGPEPAPVPGRRIALHAGALPGVSLRAAAVQSRPRTGSESSPTRFRVDSERVQGRFRVGSEYEYEATQGGRTNASPELRTATIDEPLAANPLLASADAAPHVTSTGFDQQRTGHLTRAFETAAHHTSGAFRTAGRTLRSVF